MPSDETIMGIKEMLKTHPAKYLIWEAYPAEAIAQAHEGRAWAYQH